MSNECPYQTLENMENGVMVLLFAFQPSNRLYFELKIPSQSLGNIMKNLDIFRKYYEW